MIRPGTLDPAPIPPPALGRNPVGRELDFNKLVKQAGMTPVVTSHALPLVTVHAGERDLKVPRPGRPIYCVAGATLPAEPRDRAKEILRRLAYGYLDWAARETVARYHRDLARPQERPRERDGLPVKVLVRRAIRSKPGITVGEIVSMTGIVQPNVSRAISALQEAGEIAVERQGRHSICRMITECAEMPMSTLLPQAR